MTIGVGVLVEPLQVELRLGSTQQRSRICNIGILREIFPCSTTRRDAQNHNQRLFMTRCT